MMIQPNDYLYPWNPTCQVQLHISLYAAKLDNTAVVLSSFKPVPVNSGGNSTSFKIIKYTNKKIHLCCCH